MEKRLFRTNIDMLSINKSMISPHLYWSYQNILQYIDTFFSFYFNYVDEANWPWQYNWCWEKVLQISLFRCLLLCLFWPTDYPNAWLQQCIATKYHSLAEGETTSKSFHCKKHIPVSDLSPQMELKGYFNFYHMFIRKRKNKIWLVSKEIKTTCLFCFYH